MRSHARVHGCQKPVWRLGLLVAGALVLSGLWPGAASAFWSRTLDLCAAQLEIPPLSFPAIAAGCERPGCCPECTDPSLLDWKVEVVAEPFVSLDLRFSQGTQVVDVGGDATPQIQAEGAAQRLAGNVFQLGAGTSVLKAVPLERDARPVIASVGLHLDPRVAAQAFSRRSAEVPVGTELSRLEFVIEQRLGERVVARSEGVVRWRRCPVGRPRTDRIDLDNNLDRDAAVVFLTGRREDRCSEREVWRGRDVLYVGDVRNDENCPSWVSVFSSGNAVRVLPIPTAVSVSGSPQSQDSDPPGGQPSPLGGAGPRDVAKSGWDSGTNGRLSVALEPLVALPSIVWLLSSDGSRVSELRARAGLELALADALFRGSRCGLGLLTQNLTLPADSEDGRRGLIDRLVESRDAVACASVQEEASALGWWDERNLNVYYVDAAITGLFCRRERLVVVGTLAQPETLAAQIAGVLGLGTVSGQAAGVDFDGDRDADFGSENLLWDRASRRSGLSLGQCQRIHLSPASMINQLGLRSGPRVACPPAGELPKGCLPLGTHVVSP